MTVSIIICTRNRADILRPTLEALGQVTVPEGWTAELLVVDNGSTDHTQMVASKIRLSNMAVRYLHESKPGQCQARNTGMSASQGEIIIFTDDDVRPARDWLEKMAGPMLAGSCDAVVGAIRAAECLHRPWMTSFHKVWVTIPAGTADSVPELVGANMGFRRLVLERVPAFDTELGPGSMGFGDDTLFSWQLGEAGFRLRRIPDALVVHHFEATRLLHSAWVADARKRGRSAAYLLHHWRHGEIKWPRLRLGYLSAKLLLRRLVQPPPGPNEEGCPPWEMSYLAEMELCRQFMVERKRPRNYARHGLLKRDMQAGREIESGRVVRGTVPKTEQP
jgi:glycosyltransferase involved in cell wall biosynthesis